MGHSKMLALGLTLTVTCAAIVLLGGASAEENAAVGETGPTSHDAGLSTQPAVKAADEERPARELHGGYEHGRSGGTVVIVHHHEEHGGGYRGRRLAEAGSGPNFEGSRHVLGLEEPGDAEPEEGLARKLLDRGGPGWPTSHDAGLTAQPAVKAADEEQPARELHDGGYGGYKYDRHYRRCGDYYCYYGRRLAETGSFEGSRHVLGLEEPGDVEPEEGLARKLLWRGGGYGGWGGGYGRGGYGGYGGYGWGGGYGGYGGYGRGYWGR